MNKVFLMGKVATPPVSKSFKSFICATFKLSIQEKKFTDGIENFSHAFYEIECWGKLIDSVLNLKVADLIYVEAKIDSKEFTNKAGIQCTFMKLKMQSFQMILSSEDNSLKDYAKVDSNISAPFDEKEPPNFGIPYTKVFPDDEIPF